MYVCMYACIWACVVVFTRVHARDPELTGRGWEVVATEDGLLVKHVGLPHGPVWVFSTVWRGYPIGWLDLACTSKSREINVTGELRLYQRTDDLPRGR